MVTSASTVSTVYWFHTKRPPHILQQNCAHAPERLVFKTGQWDIERTRYTMLGNLNPQVTRDL